MRHFITNHTIFYCFIFSCLLAYACSTSRSTTEKKNKISQNDISELDAKYVVYHLNDSISRLYYDISNELIMYRKQDTSTRYYSNLKIELRTNNANNNITNYNDTMLYDKQNEAIVKRLRGSFDFKLPNNNNYKATINVIDYNKNNVYTQSLSIEKTTNETRQNFLITNTNNEILYTNYFSLNEAIFLYTQRYKEKQLNVDLFDEDFKLAPPPFANNIMPKFNYKPDSSYTINVQQNRFEVRLPQKGFIHLKTNPNTKIGVTCFVYEQGFPKIKNNEQMILATRYIMSKKEFENCLNNSDKKAAIDRFWLDVAGNNDRARELIRKYYLRVQDANRLFTSYQEGWRTDRGMIYIVFGKPNKILTRDSGELWTYGNEGNPTSLQFSFTKIINPFTDNDYYLERTEEYKERWYQAVDMWRQGKIYLDH